MTATDTPPLVLPLGRDGRILRHGRKVRVKGIVCTSSTQGMRYVNDSRHGLQIGAHSVRLF